MTPQTGGCEIISYGLIINQVSFIALIDETVILSPPQAERRISLPS
jgi:hypothetical protein